MSKSGFDFAGSVKGGGNFFVIEFFNPWRPMQHFQHESANPLFRSVTPFETPIAEEKIIFTIRSSRLT